MEDVDTEIENEEFVDVEMSDIDFPGFASTSSEMTVPEEEIESLPDDFVGKPPEIDYDSIGEFCFESDELALKGNIDYKNLLEAMVVLEAQKAKALKDLERLKKLQDEALSDPFEFLECLKRKENMNFPMPQKVYPIPVIDWSKYALSGNPSAFCRRQIALISAKVAEDISRSKTKLKYQNNESKSIDTTQLWTTEEEKQLRDLMIEFPPEENEAQRWEKISSCLKNRTPSEVATRAHLYISLLEDKNAYSEKLHDLGLSKTMCHVPEPGEQKSYDTENINESRIDILNDVDISPDLQDSLEFQELVLLENILRKKLDSNNLSRHAGYKCCRCKAEPIVGIRWHCIDCKPPLSIDFCNDCTGCSYETSQHSADHRVERIHASKEFLDQDYMQFCGSDYNYLDPNYMPAT